MLATDGFEKTGAYAAFHCQMENLNLPPWQHPPLDASHGEAFELLERMLRLGVSKFEPDPVRACEEAERRKAAS